MRFSQPPVPMVSPNSDFPELVEGLFWFLRWGVWGEEKNSPSTSSGMRVNG